MEENEKGLERDGGWSLLTGSFVSDTLSMSCVAVCGDMWAVYLSGGVGGRVTLSDQAPPPRASLDNGLGRRDVSRGVDEESVRAKRGMETQE